MPFSDARVFVFTLQLKPWQKRAEDFYNDKIKGEYFEMAKSK